MGVYRFLASSRWLGGLALAAAFAVVCVSLGLWQWDRRTARYEANQVITGNYDRQPVPAPDLLPASGDLDPAHQWRPVTARGEYVEEATTLLRQRPVDGQVGFHVLVPLVLDGAGPGEPDDPDGTDRPTAVLVDRGFVPAGDAEEDVEVPAAPTGEVEALVHLRPGEEPFGQAPPGQTRSIDLGALSVVDGVAVPLSAAGADLSTAGYGVLAEETPAAAISPAPLPAPPVDGGPHLSYAFQWWVFALGGFVGFGVVARRHADDLRADAAEEAAAGPAAAPPAPGRRQGPVRVTGAARARRVPSTSRRRPSAEDEEDALLDAAEQRRLAPSAADAVTPDGARRD